jgi:RNA polymerase sigma factor (sigma-70 family)
MTTADSVRIDHFRRKERRREVPFGKTEDGKTLEPPERVPTQEEVLELKRIAALWDCINKLDQKRQYAKILRADLAGKKYEQIAEEFEVSSGTVGAHLNTARKKLKKCLDLKANLAG